MQQCYKENTVFTNSGDIRYYLTIKNVKNINIRIKPDGKVYVSANNKTDIEDINKLIQKKSTIIKKTVNSFLSINNFNISAKQYLNGENFNYLGNQLRLKIVESDVNQVNTDGVFLYLKTDKPVNTEHNRKTVEMWYQKQCETVFADIVREVYLKFKIYEVDYPLILIRKMSSRWGSCNKAQNKITLNKNLIEVPRNCIRYVITHEFAHFIHPNHSKHFYDLLQIMMPDWKEVKAQLEEYYVYSL